MRSRPSLMVGGQQGMELALLGVRRFLVDADEQVARAAKLGVIAASGDGQHGEPELEEALTHPRPHLSLRNSFVDSPIANARKE